MSRRVARYYEANLLEISGCPSKHIVSQGRYIELRILELSLKMSERFSVLHDPVRDFGSSGRQQ
jgi:hypothetical protein